MKAIPIKVNFKLLESHFGLGIRISRACFLVQLKCFRRESGTCSVTASSLVASAFHWTRRLSFVPISTSQRDRQITHTAKLTMSVQMTNLNKLEKISSRRHMIMERRNNLSSPSLRNPGNVKSSLVQTKEVNEVLQELWLEQLQIQTENTLHKQDKAEKTTYFLDQTTGKSYRKGRFLWKG